MVGAMISRRRRFRFFARGRSRWIGWKRRGTTTYSGIRFCEGVAAALAARGLRDAGNGDFDGARVQARRPRRRRRRRRRRKRLDRDGRLADARPMDSRPLGQRITTARRRRFASLHQPVAAAHEIVQLNQRRRRRLRQRRREPFAAAQQVGPMFTEQCSVTDARQIPRRHVADAAAVNEPRRRTQPSRAGVSTIRSVRRISVEWSIVSVNWADQSR